MTSSQRYKDIEQTLQELETAMKCRTEEKRRQAEEAIAPVEAFIDTSKHAVQNILVNVTTEVREQPWAVVGKVALTGLGIGMMLGKRYKAARSNDERGGSR